MADAQWTKGSDGTTNVYASESGMVGVLNSAGNWVLWMPNPSTQYESEYWGRRLAVQNIDGDVYRLTMNGQTTTRRYDPRWKGARLFDAYGTPIQSPEDGQIKGDPLQAYFYPGVQVTQPATNVASVQTADTATVKTSTSGAPDPATTRTRSSDGRTDVYAGDSGMVGIFDKGRNAWLIFMPPPGVEYSSFYWGGDIAMRNNGDGTYFLDADGIKARRAYSGRWKAGMYYDRNGRIVSDPTQATAQGDPADIFFVPGAIAEGTTPTAGATTPPATPQPRLPVTGGQAPVTGGQAPATGGQQPGPVYVTGGGFVATPPDPGDFPNTDLDPTGPGTTGAQISGKIIALAAVAAFALLR